MQMNMFCLFVEILEAIILVRQDKRKDFQLFSQQRGRPNLFSQCCQKNFRIVSGLKEFVALLKYIQNNDDFFTASVESDSLNVM